MELDLNELRKEIDACDAKIVALLNERFRIVLKVGEYKKSKGEPVVPPVEPVLDLSGDLLFCHMLLL